MPQAKKDKREGKDKKERREKKGGKKVIAKQATTVDKFSLHQQICQASKNDNISFFNKLFTQYKGNDAVSLREGYKFMLFIKEKKLMFG